VRDDDLPKCPECGIVSLEKVGAAVDKASGFTIRVVYKCPICKTIWRDEFDGNPLVASQPKKEK
jgi:uncharacterized C2H2 Zn-finger protein